MKYVEYRVYPSQPGEKEDVKDVRLVDISEADAAELNRGGGSEEGDWKKRYRKANESDLKKFSKQIQKQDVKKEDAPAPAVKGLIDGKNYDEWTVRELKAFAEDKDIEFEEGKKQVVFESIIKALNE